MSAVIVINRMYKTDSSYCVDDRVGRSCKDKVKCYHALYSIDCSLVKNFVAMEIKFQLLEQPQNGRKRAYCNEAYNANVAIRANFTGAA